MRPSRSFNILGLILLGWNLMGLAAFILQYSTDLATLAKNDPYTAQIFAQMPGWTWAAYAVAVGAGTLGATLLLMRKAAAVGLFLLSVIAVIVQFGYSLLGTDCSPSRVQRRRFFQPSYWRSRSRRRPTPGTSGQKAY